jgi:hypothetical protein
MLVKHQIANSSNMKRILVRTRKKGHFLGSMPHEPNYVLTRKEFPEDDNLA